MPAFQKPFDVATRGRGMTEVTSHIAGIVRDSGIVTGLATIFCQHTSCSLVIMENADPSARRDLEDYFERLAPDADPRYSHTAEGPDDMSAHLRMALTRTHETIPVGAGRLLLGTWQGVFLWEHRTHPHRRSLIVTVAGE